ncbi:methyltransferase domain-containing protein [Plectonema cf. radiosum LEGE 06105]|uniref:Methyltransferase domain-containing protein n=1 Tax=Plectonema cf. radiosum LEGE 06105 TaxID=945769 RepID=A0A8J7K1J6_9CYAN|nr:class I SAM-dependent methyltransferase [Plectonema radiosum]MBE9211962.1 methyltransferase domain-containing protein [Plectonema cf. radiosum LEGE 06105]
MAIKQDTLWERFLSPVVRLLIDEEELRRYSESVDWEKESDRFRRNDVTIPQYYSSQNFHGIERGYLNPGAAVTYDAVTQYALPPNETWIRQALIDRVKVKPRRILDLGCGTGSTTLMLKQAFGDAQVIGLDLSPYMLLRGFHKSQSANLNIEWQQGNAENTSFPDETFDLVTASLLFHETPSTATQAILHECFRLLVAGGQVLILDGNQKTLRQLEWLNNIFEEPYIDEYANSSTDAIMGAAGFAAVRTEDVWFTSQLTSGIKPISVEDASTYSNVKRYVPTSPDNTLDNNQLFPSPA